MKKLLFAILLLASLASRATTVDAYYIFTDFNVNTQQVRRVVQTPLQPFADYSGAILVPTPIVHTTDTNGYAAFSNTVAGYAYRISVDTPFGTTVRTSGYPVGLTGYVNGRDYLGEIHSMAFYYLHQTNAFTGSPNQFGTDPAGHVTIKSGSTQTNPVFYGSIIGDGGSITNVQSPSPLAYLNLQNLPFQLTNRMGVGNLKIMERLSSVINYTNILPLASTNTVDTRLIDLLTNAAYGTCIVLSNGTYNIGNAAVVMAPGVMMIGQSTSNTVVYKQGNGTGGLQCGITERRDCCLANFTFYESASAANLTSGLVVDSGTYSDNFGILAANVVFLMDSDSGRFNNFNGEIETYNCWFESHWDGWVMDFAVPGSRALAYNNFHLNDVTRCIHSSPDGDRPLRSASYFRAFYCTFVAKDTFNPGDADSICVGPCGAGVFLGDCIFSLTTTSDPAQSQVGQVFGSTTLMTIVSGGTYDASKFVNKVRILQ